MAKINSNKVSKNMSQEKLIDIIFLSIILFSIALAIGIFALYKNANIGINITLSTNQEFVANSVEGEGNYFAGDSITIKAKNIEGYEFKNWTCNGVVVSTQRHYTFIVCEETKGEYVANYTPIDYEVGVDNLKGSFEVAATANVGQEVTLSNVSVNNGYNLKGIYYIAQGQEEKVKITDNKFIMPAKNITIVAEYTPVTYSILYALNADEVLQEPIYSYNIETPSFYLQQPSKDGYDFVGWTGEGIYTPAKLVSISCGSVGNRVYTPVFSPKEFTIATSQEITGGEIVVNPKAGYETEVSVNVISDTGYSLAHLFYINENTSERVSIIDNTFTMPMADVTIYATFEAVDYALKVKALSVGKIELKQSIANYTQTISPTFIANDGYVLDKTYYSTDDGLSWILFEDSFSMPACDVVITAGFVCIIYNIAYDYAGGEDVGGKQTYTIEDEDYLLPQPTKEGNIFLGWVELNDGEAEPLEYLLKGSFGDKSFVAKWRKERYQITFRNYDNTILAQAMVEYGTLPVYSGQTPTKSSTVDTAFTFAGWNIEIAPATENATYTATYTQSTRKYLVSFDSRGGTSVDSKNIEYNTKIGTLPETSRDHYTFIGWYSAPASGVKATENTIVTGEITYYAHWKTVNYTITLQLDGGSVSGNNPILYTVETDDFSLPMAEKEGHTFIGWAADGQTPTKDYVIVKGSTGNLIINAYYSVNNYEISWENHDGTLLDQKTIAYGELPVYEGPTPTKVGDVEFSYTFIGWTPEIAAVSQNTTYVATYQAISKTYTFSFDAKGGEEVSAITQSYGTTLETLPQTSKEGYNFVGWFAAENGGGECLSTQTTFEENRVWHAYFTIKTHTVTWVNYDGSILAEESYNHYDTPEYKGETPTKPEDSEGVYTFSGWSPVLSTVTGSVVYTAVFTTTSKN